MGETVKLPVVGTQQHNQGGADPQRTAARRSSGDRSTAAAADRTPRSGGAAAGGTAGGKTEEKKEKSLGLPLVKSETATIVPAPAEPKKNTPKKPRKKQQPKKPDTGFSAEQISALIVGASSIIGSRKGFEMFTLTEAEAMQLATPIANMAAKSEKLANAGEYADAIALVTAAFLIFTPRIIMYTDMKKEEKKRQKEGVRIVQTERKTDGDGREDRPKNPRPVQSDDLSVLSAIPALV